MLLEFTYFIFNIHLPKKKKKTQLYYKTHFTKKHTGPGTYVAPKWHVWFGTLGSTSVQSWKLKLADIRDKNGKSTVAVFVNGIIQ